MKGAILYLLVGSVLFWLGLRQWRLRHQESISLIELGLLKATKSEPLPLNDYDRKAQPVFAVLNLIFGTFFFLVGLLVLASVVGSL